MSTVEMQAEREMESCLCGPGEWVGRVQSGDFDGGPHASTWVCGLAAHRAAAETWAEAVTGLPAHFVPKGGS